MVLGISSAINKDEGGLRGMYWKRVSEVMVQLGYPEREWSEKWIEAAKHRKRWRQGVSEVVKRYKQDLDYDTWENRHTEQDTSFERQVRQEMTKGALAARGAEVGSTAYGLICCAAAHLRNSRT